MFAFKFTVAPSLYSIITFSSSIAIPFLLNVVSILCFALNKSLNGTLKESEKLFFIKNSEPVNTTPDLPFVNKLVSISAINVLGSVF